MRCPHLSKITYAFLQDKLSLNFDKYLNPEHVDVAMMRKVHSEVIIDDTEKEVEVEEVDDVDEILYP
jgi:hypothetical protein